VACPLPSYRNGSYVQQAGVCVTRPLLVGGVECAGRRDSICLPVCWMAVLVMVVVELLSPLAALSLTVPVVWVGAAARMVV